MTNTTIKQVLVLRKDLNMRKGKMAAQASHASMAPLFGRSLAKKETNPDGTTTLSFTINADQLYWFETFSAKIVVGVGSEQELMEVLEHAQQLGLPVSLIQDAGLTEFGGVPTYTAVGIGPAQAELIDKVTGNLSLL